MEEIVMKRNEKLKMLLKNKKGFTLVEVIVVLVILAILAAISIPALTGYIDQANERAAISEAKTIHTALQSIGMLSYAADKEPSAYCAGKSGTIQSEVASLSGFDVVGKGNLEVLDQDFEKGNNVYFVWRSNDGTSVVYTDGEFLIF